MNRTLVTYLRIWIGAVCAAAAACLIWQTIGVWSSGGDPLFSREIVLARLGAIAPVLILCAVSCIAGAIFLPSAEEKARIDSLTRLEARVVPPRDARKLSMVACIGTVAACLALLPAVLSLMEPGRFASRDLEQVMGSVLRGVMPFVALALAIRIAEEEIRLHLAGKVLESRPARKTEQAPRERALARNLLRAGIGIAAVAFLAVGAVNGGAWDVLVKAINICTECIGLG